MPTIITHAVVPLCIAAGFGRSRITPGITCVGAVLAMLPDADVIGFKLGVAYADQWGHRGATHSLVFGLATTVLVLLALPAAQNRMAAAFLFAAAVSHGLLDMLTDGGLGVALFWPIETGRHFFAFRPIRVSPIGAGFFSQRGLETVWSELACVWLPGILAAIFGRLVLRRSEPL